MKVAVIGRGAIGAPVAAALAGGGVPGAELLGVLHRGTAGTDLLERADLVVECAGQAALAELGPAVRRAGKDLLVVSVGALADESVFRALVDPPAGRVHVCAGAVGGLDLLGAAARMDPALRVSVTTTKRAGSLVEPAPTEGPVELARGPARKVTALYPRSANVAAAVALAVRSWENVEAALIADPAAELTSHVITATGTPGSYRFEINNRPDERTPTTSAVVPFAVLRSIGSLVGERLVLR